MVKGLDTFRATRDLDMVLIVESLTQEFGDKFWEFIESGKYRNKARDTGSPQFYSQLFIDPLIGEYNRGYFREMLRDWKFEF